MVVTSPSTVPEIVTTPFTETTSPVTWPAMFTGPSTITMSDAVWPAGTPTDPVTTIWSRGAARAVAAVRSESSATAMASLAAIRMDRLSRLLSRESMPAGDRAPRGNQEQQPGAAHDRQRQGCAARDEVEHGDVHRGVKRDRR